MRRSSVATDLLFEVPWGEAAHGGPNTRADVQSESSATPDAAGLLLYILFEHQSTPDPLMPYRMLRYALRIWDRWLTEHEGARSLPPLLPLVLFHGGQR